MKKTFFVFAQMQILFFLKFCSIRPAFSDREPCLLKKQPVPALRFHT